MLHTHYKKFQIFLKKAKNICILSHKSPDADTIGANLALRYALEQQEKRVFSVCEDTILEKFSFLKEADSFQKKLDMARYDLIIAVDIADKHLLGFTEQSPQIFSFFPFINIDHHPDNPLFGNLNIVHRQAPSTTAILYHLFKFLNMPISRDMATALLLGLYGDTGSFMHANTSKEAYDIAGDLMGKGAHTKVIIERMFHYFPVNRLHLWGKVFQRTSVNKSKVISSVIRQDDFRETKTDSEDLSGVVEYLNMVPEGKFTLLLTEDEKKGIVKGSLRTLRDNVDVSSIAHKYGGGGHKKASGFSISGKIEEERIWKVVNEKDGDVIKNVKEM